MSDKTQKIAAELHRLLKMQALKEGKTLQELTEEILRDGMEERSPENAKELPKPRGQRKT